MCHIIAFAVLRLLPSEFKPPTSCLPAVLLALQYITFHLLSCLFSALLVGCL